jgi:hypothetical protein
MQKDKIRILIVIIALTIGAKQAVAQENAKTVYERILKAYETKEPLAFDVRYTYENKAKPGVVEDSLQGSFLLTVNKYWGMLDSTEFVKEDSISVTLFHDDRIMMLAKTDSDGLPGPMQLPDSLFANNSHYQFSHKLSGTTGVFSMVFKKAASAWHRIEMVYDRNSYLLKEMMTEMLVVADEDGFRAAPPKKNNAEGEDDKMETGIVRVRFLNYRKELMMNDKMKARLYYNKEGGKIYPADAYEGYEVFVSTEGF